jgi:hypothetical protein
MAEARGAEEDEEETAAAEEEACARLSLCSSSVAEVLLLLLLDADDDRLEAEFDSDDGALVDEEVEDGAADVDEDDRDEAAPGLDVLLLVLLLLLLLMPLEKPALCESAIKHTREQAMKCGCNSDERAVGSGRGRRSDNGRRSGGRGGEGAKQRHLAAESKSAMTHA